MKRWMNFVMFLMLCPGGYTYYDWNVTASELSSDFTNQLKLEAELHNELQTDLLKMSKLPEPYAMRGSNSLSTFIQDPTEDLWPSHQKYTSADDSNAYMTRGDKKERKQNKAGKQQKHQHTHPTQNHEHHKCRDETSLAADSNEDEENEDDGDVNDEGDLDGKEDSGSTKADEIELKRFVGTNLFDSIHRKCFSIEDVALLTARKDFEILLPKTLPDTLLNDHLVSVIMNYFYNCHEIIAHETNGNAKRTALKAFYDALGGFLNYYVVPVAKYSFYSGQLSLQTVDNVIILHKQCKGFLNVNGNGWKAPMRDVVNKLKDIHIEPWTIADNKTTNEPSFCMQLDMSCSEQETDDDKMIVPLPKLESEDHDNLLGNIWVPFKRKRIYNLRAENSMYILVKYYETVTKCYQFEKINQEYFNTKFKNWIFENIYVHLTDDVLYPGLGAVLRIYEGLKHFKKSTAFEYGLKETIEDLAKAPSTGPDVKRWKKSHTQAGDNRAENRTVKKKTKVIHTRNQAVKAPNINIEIKVPSELSMAQSLLAAANVTETAVSKQFLQVLKMNPLLFYILFSAPAILIIIIICICLKKGKKKKVVIQKPVTSASSKGKLRGSSDSIRTSSDIACEPLTKCSPCTQKRRGPALIETTSLDYTSSETEDKKAIAKAKIKGKEAKPSDVPVKPTPSKLGKASPTNAPPAKGSPSKASLAAKGSPAKATPAKASAAKTPPPTPVKSAKGTPTKQTPPTKK